MRTALITGGSRGIGAALVRSFCGAGYRVAFFYRQDEKSATLLAHETGAVAICCDVANRRQVDEACAKAFETLSHIYVLVNNAGIAQQKLFTDITDEDWEQMLSTNLSSSFYMSRAVLPDMIMRKSGRIINISSIWGQIGASCEVHYSASKAGLIGMTKALAKEIAPSGITVNCVCPGVIQTDMLSSFNEEELCELVQQTPIGRLGKPQDVASCALWLASECAGFITGQILGVNGGYGE